MGKNILITGGSGLIGTRLTRMLIQRGHRVSHLGRSKQNSEVHQFTWDINLHIMDPRAVASADVIIHLAGAGIAEERWTKKRKNEIRQSRVQSTSLLYDLLRKGTYPVKTFISGSAIGYYGFGDDRKVFTESDRPGSDFLASVTDEWEKEADKIGSLSIRLVKLRTGVVLSEDGGALQSIARPIKFGVGAPVGDGKQIISWIHIDDLCLMFCKVAEDNGMQGVFNGVAPSPVTNLEFTRAVAKTLKRPLWAPAIPSFILKILLGEMASIVLGGSNVSAEKILKTGFEFRFPNLQSALNNIYND
jgi:uncharacterized protein (TIGR01777 family)